MQITKKLKTQLYIVIFGTHTRAGRAFDVGLLLAIMSSILILVIDSLPTLSITEKNVLKYAEFAFTFLFTLEYLLRLYCSPKPIVYARSFFGIIDILSILPSYLALIFPMANYWGVIRILRILRIFRILKLIRYLKDSNILLMSLKKSRRKILVFFSSVGVMVTILGALIFVVEGPENGFTSLPKSIYWAIVTITTVGYGDIAPQTPLGQTIAAVTMLLGYSIITVPTGIYSVELHNEILLHRSLVTCPNCLRSGHEMDAMYCKYCGYKLPEPKEKTASGKNIAS